MSSLPVVLPRWAQGKPAPLPSTSVGAAAASLPEPSLPATISAHPADGTPRTVVGGLTARSGFERRHQMGIQIGGTGMIQGVYRLRAVGPVHLEIGALAGPHGVGNVSAGLLIGVPIAHRWFLYGGSGGGWLFDFGPTIESGCDPAVRMADGSGENTLAFLHARIGIGIALGRTCRHLISLDVGGWRGTWTKRKRIAD